MIISLDVNIRNELVKDLLSFVSRLKTIGYNVNPCYDGQQDNFLMPGENPLTGSLWCAYISID